MKKYIVKHKDSERVVDEYDSRAEASKKLIEYVNRLNEGLEHNYITIFDFDLDEVEKEVNEVITDFESAKKYLVGNTNDVFGVVKKRLSKSIEPIKDAEILIKELNPKHIEALIALNELFTIAQAWNKADGFVPDFSNRNQWKYFPWFTYNNDAAGFVYARTDSSPMHAHANIGSRLCFKSESRAEQFGKQFATLYNKAFL